MPERIVVIGAVAAGPKAACRARRLLPDAEIILLDQDDIISYGGCGIPYFVSGDVADEKELCSTSYHMVRNPDYFESAKGLMVMTRTRAESINRKKKVVVVTDLESGKQQEFSYDKLVIATGSRPNRLPVPGSDLQGIFTISNLHKAVAIKEKIARGQVGKAVVVGGGAIGIEMAEALTDLWGVETTLIEYMPQLLPGIVDWEIAGMVQQHLMENNVDVLTGEAAMEFVGDEKGHVRKVVTGNRELDADLVIMAVGVRPRSELARDAGLEIGPLGGIVVNRRMQTSDPDIFAAGDCVESLNLVTGKQAYAPFGSIANRQGRVAADNLAGIPSQFTGVVGSFIMKVFDRCVGATGISLDTARREGFDAVAATTVQTDRAHFMAGMALIFNHMVVDRSNRRVLGLQGFANMGDGLMARIDAAAGMIARHASVSEFSNLEMAYAPPFSTAVDVLNSVANIADNICSGRMITCSPREFVEWMDGKVEHPDWMVLDLRHPNEAVPWAKAYPDRWYALVYNEVRHKWQEIPRDRTLILICNAGTRAYEMQLFLKSKGIDRTLVLAGGLNLIRRLGVDWWIDA